MSSANPIALLTPAPDPVAAARARLLGGILFLVAGVVRVAYSPFLDSDLVVVLMIGGVIESAALAAGFLLLLRGGVPGTSTAAKILAFVLAGAYALQLILSLLLAVDGVFFLALGLGFLALLAGIAYSIVATMNPALHQLLRRLPLALFVGLILSAFVLAGEPVLVYIVTGVLFAGFGLAVVLLARKDLAGRPLFAPSEAPRAPADGSAPSAPLPPAAPAPAAPTAPVPPVAASAAPVPPVPASAAPAAAMISTPARAAAAAPNPTPAPSALPVAGWYADPAGSDQLRLWDGERWTDQLRPWPSSPRGA